MARSILRGLWLVLLAPALAGILVACAGGGGDNGDDEGENGQQQQQEDGEDGGDDEGNGDDEGGVYGSGPSAGVVTLDLNAGRIVVAG